MVSAQSDDVGAARLLMLQQRRSGMLIAVLVDVL